MQRKESRLLRSDFRLMPTVVPRDTCSKGYIIGTRYNLGVWTKYRPSETLSEFLFKFFDSVTPVDWFGSLVMISDVVVERAFEGTGAGKMSGLHVFALEHTEPDFDLIEPGRIGRQPEHLKVEVPVTDCFLLA